MTKTTETDTTKAALKAGAKARSIALQQFRDEHPAEWDKIVGDCRVEFGLPRERRGPGKVARLEAEVAELRRLLAEKS